MSPAQFLFAVMAILLVWTAGITFGIALEKEAPARPCVEAGNNFPGPQ